MFKIGILYISVSILQQQMVKTNLLLLIIVILYCQIGIGYASRVNLTDFYNKLLGRNNTIEVWDGYQDIQWYVNPQIASVYYSVWQCSTKRFTDHTVPVIFYLAGGQLGTASQSAAFRQYGPYQIIKNSSGKYQAIQNPWALNYFGHLVFVDQPIGTGFSYNTQKTVGSISTAANHFTNFLYNFMNKTPWNFLSNPIYFYGDAYSAQLISQIYRILTTNKTIGIFPKGIILSNPIISFPQQLNTYQSYLYSIGAYSAQTIKNVNTQINSAIKQIQNNPKNGAKIRSMIDNVWKGFGNDMDLYDYRRYDVDKQGTQYINMLNANKKTLGVPDNVNYIEFNKDIDQLYSNQMFVNNYKGTLGDMINDPSKLKIMIYNGQNNFRNNAAGVQQCLKNIIWKNRKNWVESAKQKWKQSGVLRGWVKKHQNLIVVTLKNTGQYVYEDNTFATKSIWLLFGNYFSKW